MSHQQVIYQYDNLGRLTSAQFSNGALLSIAYDEMGNRTSVMELAGFAGGGQGGSLLYNGAMRFFQRQAPGSFTNKSNGDYGPDRWYMLGNSGAADIQVVRDIADSVQANACRVRNNNAAAKYTGMAQILPNSDTIALRGNTFVFQGVAKTSSAGRAMRAAILEWTGTADAVAFGGAVTRDPVLDWTSTNYTAGNFFRSTNLTVVAVSASFTPGTSHTAFSVSGSISNSANNLVLMVWEEAATPAAGTWSVSQLGLYEGSLIQLWLPAPYALDYAQCAPFYQKSYEVDIVPGQGSAAGGIRFWSQKALSAGTSGQLAQSVDLSIPAYKSSPTFVIYSIASGNANAMRNITAGGDRSNVTANDISRRGFRDIQCSTSGGVAIAKDDELEFHWTMSSEL